MRNFKNLQICPAPIEGHILCTEQNTFWSVWGWNLVVHWKLQSDRYDFSSNFLNETGFDLTFQKWFVSFPYENNRKLMLSVIHHGWATNKIFHSRLPKTVFNSIFLLFYLTENHQICILYQKTFIKKELY